MASPPRAAALAAGLVASLGPACRPGPTLPADAPNVVVILADDLGWGDVGYHGARGVATPNLDALAAEGVRLERYYTAPLCTPSRAGLLTGRSPLRLGLRRNLTDADPLGLPLDEQLLPELFARAGYRTALVGKWHLGAARPEQRPNARGFQRFYGLLGGWVDYWTHTRGGELDWWRDGELVREEGYTTRLLADEAVRLLSEPDRDAPLFLYVAFNAPHTPLHIAPGAALTRGLERPERRRAAYASMVAELDRAIGALHAALRRDGRARRTVLFFASDNGADPEYGGRNDPLRGGKYEAFDGGIRVPAFLWGPGLVEPGASDSLVSHQDVLPTLAGLARLGLEPRRPLDGVDRGPAIRSRAALERGPLAFGVEVGRRTDFALVDGRHKLVRRTTKDGTVRVWLHDLAADAEERHDLAEREAGVRDRLASKLDAWAALPASLPPLEREAPAADDALGER